MECWKTSLFCKLSKNKTIRLNRKEQNQIFCNWIFNLDPTRSSCKHLPHQLWKFLYFSTFTILWNNKVPWKHKYIKYIWNCNWGERHSKGVKIIHNMKQMLCRGQVSEMLQIFYSTIARYKGHLQIYIWIHVPCKTSYEKQSG